MAAAAVLLSCAAAAVLDFSSVAGSATRIRRGPNIAELAIDTGQASYLGDTSRYRYVILQEYMYAHVAAIKSANSRTSVLAYLEAATTQVRPCTGSAPAPYRSHDSFGINYCWAKRYHPRWFLRGRAGRPLTYPDYPAYAVMDIGRSGYQTRFARNAITAARADGFDGIDLDDVNTHPGHGIDGRLARYTDRAYGRAMLEFVKVVGDRLRAHGLLASANISADPWVPWQRADAIAMAAHLTAVNREHYSRWGDICGPFSERFNTTATNGTPPIGIEIAYDRAIQATGAHLTGIDYGYTPTTRQDRATMRYGRALFLLSWDGRPGSAYIFRPCGPVVPAHHAWMVALGRPATAVTRLANGVYRRGYQGGLVLLNPFRHRRESVRLPAGYVRTGTIRLRPEHARVIRRA